MKGLSGSSRQKEVYKYSIKHPTKTKSQIGRALGLGTATVRQYIQLEKRERT